MIYTVTLNPSLDYVMQVKSLLEGEVNRSEKECIMPGGKGINVSLILRNLGVSSVALGFVAGFTGKEIERFLEERGVAADFVFVEQGMSRINVKVHAEKETEINGAGPAVDDNALNTLLEKIESLTCEDTLVIAGSVPGSIPRSIYADIAKRLCDKGVSFVVDAEKALLKDVLSYKPFLIKPNHKELADFFGCEIHTVEDVKKYAVELKRLGAKNVLVSMAGDGAVLISSDENVYYCSTPDGKVIHSTGAGDSAVAGFLYAKQNDFSDADALRFSVCAGSATAFSEDLADKQSVFNLFEQFDASFVKIL